MNIDIYMSQKFFTTDVQIKTGRLTDKHVENYNALPLKVGREKNENKAMYDCPNLNTSIFVL